MAIKLIITEKSNPSSEYERSFIQDRVVIGRSRTADVCLPDMAVSTRHAEIRLAGSDYAIVDLESLNGTLVNDNKVLAYRNKPLSTGDTIEIANFRIQFQMGVPTPSEESRDKAVTQAREILSNLLSRSGTATTTPSLYVVSGPAKGQRTELVSQVKKWVIGRGKHVDIFIDDPDVSREHAALVVETAGIFINDLGSRNGVIFGGQRIDAAKLELGSQFSIGNTTMVLEHPAEKSLGLIFEAPEEDTASFMLAQRVSNSEIHRPSTPTPSSPPPQVEAPEKEPPMEQEPPKPIIGPSDPFINTGENNTGENNTGEHTQKHITPPKETTPGAKTDIGLIIIGSLILVAAVSGLIYIFQ